MCREWTRAGIVHLGGTFEKLPFAWSHTESRFRWLLGTVGRGRLRLLASRADRGWAGALEGGGRGQGALL